MAVFISCPHFPTQVKIILLGKWHIPVWGGRKLAEGSLPCERLKKLSIGICIQVKLFLVSRHFPTWVPWRKQPSTMLPTSQYPPFPSLVHMHTQCTHKHIYIHAHGKELQPLHQSPACIQQPLVPPGGLPTHSKYHQLESLASSHPTLPLSGECKLLVLHI